MIEHANHILALVGRQSPDVVLEHSATELAQATHDLDEWLRMGGFLPEVWTAFGLGNDNRKQDAFVDVAAPVFGHDSEPSNMQDDDRPLKDSGATCAYMYNDRGDRCTLDKGHEGQHG